MTERGFSGSEIATTVGAVALSTALYLAGGHPYLARGAAGDLIGLAILGTVVAARRRRVRHEALWCLVCIGVVHLMQPNWPVDLAGVWWWSAVTAALGVYVAVRHQALARGS